MLNFVFNVEHEWYCLYFRPGCLSFKQAIIMQIKIFVNILAIALAITLPITLMFFITHYIDSIQ